VEEKTDGKPNIYAKVSDGILLAMAGLAPWAFGSVEAWAQLGLACGIALLAAMRLLDDLTSPARTSPTRLLTPGLPLAGLALLAAFQAAPLPEGILGRLAPTTRELRSELAPGRPQVVVGDPGHPVAPPAPTIAIDPETTAHSAFTLGAAWVLFRCSLAAGGRGMLRRLGLMTAANAALMALFSLIQALTWDGRIYWFRPSPIDNGWYSGGPFVGHSHLAAYLNLGLGFVAGFVLTGPQGRGRGSGGGRHYWGWYAAGLILVGLLASHSRSGVLSAVVATAVTVPLLRPKGRLLWAGLGGLALLLLAFLLAMGSTSPLERVASVAEAGATGLNGRSEIWKGSIEAWGQYGFWGVGLGGFGVALPRFLHTYLGVAYLHAENEYIQMLVEGGIPGLALLLVGMAGVGWLGRRALASARTPADRGLIVGAIFGLVALASQSVGDFAMHIPGIAVSALVLAANLSRIGMESGRAGGAPPARARRRLGRAVDVLVDAGALALSLAALAHGFVMARAEAAAAGSGLPMPGSDSRVAYELELPKERLEQMRDSLRLALADRPDWAEGHLHLGSVFLELYKRDAAGLIDGAEGSADETAQLADPLWLHGSVHMATAEQIAEVGLLEHEPIRLDLIPAARCFLEARRCSPFLAPPHAQLAVLDYLVEGGEASGVHAARALMLAGPDISVIEQAAIVAVQSDDLGLAARCWRRALEVRKGDWAWVADAAGAALEPERIVEEVLPPGGHFEILFADRLYSSPESEPEFERFLKASLDRSAREPGRPPVERRWLEAQVLARLDDRDRARELMERSVAAEPLRSDWRREYAAWLLVWDDAEAARRQAQIGLHLVPADRGLRDLLAQATDAHARTLRPARPEADDPDRGRSVGSGPIEAPIIPR
jgi:O-antigen ligase